MPITLNDAAIHPIKISEEYQHALVQYSEDVSLLAKNALKIDPLLAQFVQAFKTPLVEIDEKGFSLNDSKQHAFFNPLHAPVACVTDAKEAENPFEKRFCTQLFGDVSGEVLSVLSLRSLVTQVADKMHECGKLYQLSYHIIGHAIEMMHDTRLLAKLSGLSYQWSFFAGICGLFHDAVFTRQRVQDEKASAKLMIDAVEPFIVTLPDESKKLFQALIRAVIAGGTTPIFFKTLDASLRMLVLSEFYQQYFPEHRCALVELLNVCRVISDADIQRSLVPELLADFPGCGGVSGFKNLMLIKEKAFDEKKQEFSGDAKIVTTMMFVRLGQSTRFLIEGRNLSTHAARIKLARFLRNGVEAFKVDEFTVKEVDYIAELMTEEISFAAIQKNSLYFRDDKRSYTFVSNCLQWHENFLKAIQVHLSKDTVSLHEKNELLKDLIINAMNSQGLRVNMQRLLQQYDAPVLVDISSPVQRAVENVRNVPLVPGGEGIKSPTYGCLDYLMCCYPFWQAGCQNHCALLGVRIIADRPDRTV